MNIETYCASRRRVTRLISKEFRTLLETPVAYIVVALFLGVSEFLFFRNVFMAGEASLSMYFGVLPWLLLIVVPALTMGVFASERESGTYETLATQPLTEWEIVAGKFLSHVALLAGAIALAVFPMAITFSFFSNIDWGMVWAGYIASAGLVALFVAIGVAVSAYMEKQVSAFMVSVVILFFLIIAGTDLVAGAMPVFFTKFFERVSAMSHHLAMARGALDVRDLWYITSGVVAFLALAFYRLVTLRYGATHAVRTRWRVWVTLIVVTVLVSNVLGSAIPGRIDLTEDENYTLSDTTKRILADLPDMVQITIYASGALPAQLQPILRDVRDVLKDYERYGKGDVRVFFKDPTVSEDIADEVQRFGVQPVQFNVMGQGELSVKQGYLGVVVAYAGEHRAIPFVERTNDLEYQITSMMRELTVTEKKTIAFLEGHGERVRLQEYRAFSGELEKLYEVRDLAFDDASNKLPEGATSTDVLVVLDPGMPLGTTTREYLRERISTGGATLFAVQGTRVDGQSLSPLPSTSDVRDVLREYGVEVSSDLVYDLRSREMVQVGGGGGMVYLVPYSYWVRANAVPGSPVTAKLETVLMPWANEVSYKDTEGTTITPLVVTSRYAGVMGEPYDLSPDARLPEVGLSARTLALSLVGEGKSSARMIVVGSSDFLSDQVLGGSPANMAFGLGAVSWLAQDDSIASIKTKGGQRRVFTFGSNLEQALVAYGNMAFVVLVPLLIGLVFLLRRRALKKHTYTSLPMV